MNKCPKCTSVKRYSSPASFTLDKDDSIVVISKCKECGCKWQAEYNINNIIIIDDIS